MLENIAATLDASTPSLDRSGQADTSPTNRQRTLLVFQLGDRRAAFPVESVDRLTPMAQLACPPGLPSMLEGVLNLSGAAIPVLRLDRLFQLPERHLGLYSVLIILKGVSDGRIAILVDRISQIASVDESALLPVGEQNSFNACAESTVALQDEIVDVLSPANILMEKEQKAVSEFQRVAQQRLREWGATET